MHGLNPSDKSVGPFQMRPELIYNPSIWKGKENFLEVSCSPFWKVSALSVWRHRQKCCGKLVCLRWNQKGMEPVPQNSTNYMVRKFHNCPWKTFIFFFLNLNPQALKYGKKMKKKKKSSCPSAFKIYCWLKDSVSPFSHSVTSEYLLILCSGRSEFIILNKKHSW